MMKKVMMSMLIAAAVAMLANASLAADKDFPKATPGDTMKTTVYKSQGMATTDMVGMTVYDQNGGKLGQIKEIMVDPGMARVTYVTVAKESGEMVNIPMNALIIRTEAEEAILAVGKEKMKEVPKMQKEMTQEEYFYRLQGHYGIYPAWQLEK